MTNSIHGLPTYRLAKLTEYSVTPFGPLLRLAQAESYRDDMKLAGFHNVLVINSATV